MKIIANTLEILLDSGYRKFTERKVKSAIEKQIPKRTEIKDDETVEFFTVSKEDTPVLQFSTKSAKILCPCCGCENPTYPYCRECGQKIDGVLL